MHDIRWIRENAEAFDRGLARRGLAPMAAELLELDQRRRACQTARDQAQSKRKTLSQEIGKLKSKGGDTEALMAEVAGLKTAIEDNEREERELQAELDKQLAAIPNLPAAEVPDGSDETGNREVRRWGEPPRLNAPKQHFELGEALGMMDFERAAKIAGTRFVVLSGALARLERALGQFMLDLHTREHGYAEVSAPLLVRSEAAFGTGNLPKFAEDLFQTTDGRWLIPTAEMSLTNLVREEIVEPDKLPLRFTSLTPSFRAEAGAAGKDTRGMLRQHQFYKVELVSITAPEASEAEHERMTQCAETVLQRLGLAYRTMMLCAGDMGFGARKTYDLEVWLPGQGAYREISSCSSCGDFQARRMGARYRPKEGKGTRFVHTLNGSGLAVGRALIAVLENFQEADGSVTVPLALRPYMRGQERLVPDA
jgi:seryl-tRNA synthetase